ncbi:hypothetical protein KIL84_019104 [Mauremys mutica]|uniref:Uncharacterized protein n=1 Tax=Mauremys mutica TaxID=74926 RepID=A0A9D3XWC8_9SAUR|nr:hypothetical protein KIL84_019104 [Mauremys mutica]
MDRCCLHLPYAQTLKTTLGKKNYNPIMVAHRVPPKSILSLSIIKVTDCSHIPPHHFQYPWPEDSSALPLTQPTEFCTEMVQTGTSRYTCTYPLIHMQGLRSPHITITAPSNCSKLFLHYLLHLHLSQ